MWSHWVKTELCRLNIEFLGIQCLLSVVSLKGDSMRCVFNFFSSRNIYLHLARHYLATALGFCKVTLWLQVQARSSKIWKSCLFLTVLLKPLKPSPAPPYRYLSSGQLDLFSPLHETDAFCPCLVFILLYLLAPCLVYFQFITTSMGSVLHLADP